MEIDVNVKVLKENHELGLALGEIVKVAKKLKDEGAAADKIVTAIAGIFPALTAAIDGIDQLDDEYRKDPMKAALGLALPVLESVDVFIPKK